MSQLYVFVHISFIRGGDCSRNFAEETVPETSVPESGSFTEETVPETSRKFVPLLDCFMLIAMRP